MLLSFCSQTVQNIKGSMLREKKEKKMVPPESDNAWMTQQLHKIIAPHLHFT